MYTLDVARSWLASQLAGRQGLSTLRPAKRQPEQPLVLYEMEGCPFCRIVREALTSLDLDARILPCPKGGTRFRRDALALGGKALFPLLDDPNTGTWMYESADILHYLADTYGGTVIATRGILRRLTVLRSLLASAPAGKRGLFARPSRTPTQPLELFSFESSPYSRLVREVLCELELPYTLRNTGKASLLELGPPAVRDRLWRAPQATGRNRKVLFERADHVQVPYLIDPNAQVALFESKAIIDHLEATYALSH